jgi:hypothetical protein
MENVYSPPIGALGEPIANAAKNALAVAGRAKGFLAPASWWLSRRPRAQAGLNLQALTDHFFAWVQTNSLAY